MTEPVFVDHRLIDCTSLAPGALEQWVWEDAAAQSLLDCTTGQLRPKHTLLQQNPPQAAGGSGQHEGLEALVVRLSTSFSVVPSRQRRCCAGWGRLGYCLAGSSVCLRSAERTAERAHVEL